jgi:hypothetical protein
MRWTRWRFKHPGLLSRFGGHAMAAGLSLERAALDDFGRAFECEVAALLDADILERRLATDGELASADFSLLLARELARVSPWGQGFPEPRFDGCFRIEDRRIVGGSHARLVLTPSGTTDTVAAMAFGAAGEPWFIRRRAHSSRVQARHQRLRRHRDIATDSRLRRTAVTAWTPLILRSSIGRTRYNAPAFNATARASWNSIPPTTPSKTCSNASSH